MASMARQLIKGNEAVVKGAILAGCRAFYGYPITPATEIAECAARDLPKLDESVPNERWREIDRHALRAGLDAGKEVKRHD